MWVVGGGDFCVKAQGRWEISVPRFQFGCEPKIALKNSQFLKILGVTLQDQKIYVFKLIDITGTFL